MHIYWLQHVEFEGLGCIDPWLKENGHEVSCVRLWAGDPLPAASNQPGGQASLYSEGLCSSVEQGCARSPVREACPTALSDVDGLIVMGGPMGIYDKEQYPWLAAEKRLIKAVVDQNKPVLGICLGAQLIADVLGADVRPGREKEIGFFPLRSSSGDFGQLIPDQLIAFHWHGDTFDIPDGAVRLASSEATENQAFRYKDNVFGLQFHLETTEESLQKLYAHCSDEITDAPFVQDLEAMYPFFSTLERANQQMFHLLKQLF